MDKAKLIDNREYCSIERTAELLECAVDDIKHFLSTGAIGGYIRLLSLETQCDILMAEDQKAKIEGAAVPDELIRPILSTELSFVGELEVLENDNNMLVSVNAQIGGIWALDFHTTARLLSGEDICGASLKPSKLDGSAMKHSNTLPSVYGFSAPEGIKASDIHILKYDLIRLHESLHGEGGALPNVHNSLEVRTSVVESKVKQGRKPRTERRQSDLIMALFRTHPELYDSCEKKPSQATTFLDDFLIKEGLAPLGMDPKFFTNYRKSSTYEPFPVLKEKKR